MRQRRTRRNYATSSFYVTAFVAMTNVFIVHLWSKNHVNGFLIASLPPVQQIRKVAFVTSPSSILKQQPFDYDDDDDDEVFLTPIQIRTIRKDIIRKRANQKLPTIYYNNDDNNMNNQETKDGFASPAGTVSVEQQIVEVLISNQLVQVRGIALQDNDTRTIRNEAEQLAYRLQKRVQQQQQQQGDAEDSNEGLAFTSKSSLAYVFLVEMKGHMATFFYYIPQQQLTSPFRQQYQKTNTAVLSSSSSSSTGNSRLSPNVLLRTTGKRNDWNKRPKALRDNAGHIIK